MSAIGRKYDEEFKKDAARLNCASPKEAGAGRIRDIIRREGGKASFRKGMKDRMTMARAESALKLVWLAAAKSAKKRTTPIRSHKAAMNFFPIQSLDRIDHAA